ncbi:putative choline/carnitine O-acetyltransferase [Trypanosoma conorhini]|uniref:Putative choline/carnitine O-acetyltransferase n=1 Tax=Trypanosoma conorhini TaxID=83891 RepID=A0A3S5IUM4_9TRYP|nr:putative choline/carnitine O-acetyltransferase [Trypanosoma conorhini]RNF26763.1 putative choline/carnitine O-acetyltransferase [Trypanosoma conorhini]
MAEARFAVGPTAALHHVGFEVDTSIKKTQLYVDNRGLVLYIPHPYFILKNFRRSFWRGVDKVRFALYPIPLSVVTAFSFGVFLWVLNSPADAWIRTNRFSELLWRFDEKNPITARIPARYRMPALCANVGFGVVTVFTALQRFALRQVLKYNDWIYEARTRVSRKTKIWGFILKTFFMHTIKKTGAYENCLPSQPLPALETTVRRFMNSMVPFYEGKPDEWEQLKRLSEEFLKNEGPRLQRFLWLKYLVADNYMTDWWMKYVYLAQRERLCINSNWFGVAFAKYVPTPLQASRAAALVYNLVKVKKRIDKHTFPPQFTGPVPLDMNQYRYVFNTTRVPGREMDVLLQYEGIKHIVVIYKGRFYKLEVLHPLTNHQLTPYQMEKALESILNSEDEMDPVEALIPAFTTAPRAEWADIRDKHFIQNPYNVKPLQLIEEAIFVLCLDDAKPKSLEEEGMMYLCGNGHNRWCDKSFNAIVTEDGHCGVHAEHSWGDALTLANVVEYSHASDEIRELYADDGHVKKLPEDEKALADGKFELFAPNRIRFTTDAVMKRTVQAVQERYLCEVRDVDLRVLRFSDYGKELPKKQRCSPDAWMQMAMQLAYFRDQGRFDQTYEAASLRMYRKGRTETIRSVSEESCAFVKAMNQAAVSAEERLKLLRIACDRHQQTSRDAIAGRGIDRHLFGLYCASAGLGVASEFLQAAMTSKWKLSTSQVLPRQLPDKFHSPNSELFETPNGGFGPVQDDGYGVCYCLYGKDLVYFTVTSKHSCATTSSARLAENIAKALRDMAALAKET